MQIKQLPKIELHCHLDGCVRPETVIDIAKEEGIDLPSYDINVIAEAMIAPLECESLDEYLKRFDLPNKVMQSKESLRRITYELMEDSAEDNIKYIEIRFGPLLHTLQGLSLEEVIESVLEGMKQGESDFNIKGNIILSCLRIHPVETVYSVIESGKKYLDKGVVAIDLAASEVAGFVNDFIEPIRVAREAGFRVTIHAGETGVGQNVWDAVTYLGAERIGHGVYIRDCKEAYDLVKEKNVTLEMCPTSNVQTKAVKNYLDHPIMDFFNDDVLVTINTDNTRVSNTTMGKEIGIIEDKFDLTLEQYKTIYAYSVEASFASESEKDNLLTYLDNGLK